MRNGLIWALGSAALVQAGSALAQDSASGIARLTTSACYAIERSVLTVPDGADVTGADEALKPLGLSHGITSAMQRDLGQLGVTMISRAALASTEVGTDAIIMAHGGPQPGCRMLLTGDVDPTRLDRVAAGLIKDGWREVTALASVRGQLTRRAFVRRDAASQPYLANLLSLPEGSGRLRLVTSVAKIPANVPLPPGF